MFLCLFPDLKAGANGFLTFRLQQSHLPEGGRPAGDSAGTGSKAKLVREKGRSNEGREMNNEEK